MKKSICFIALLCWALVEPANATQNDITFIVAGKTSNYRQHSDGTLSVLNYHFFAEIFRQPDGKIETSSLNIPTNISSQITFTDSGYALEAHGGRYRTEAELEAAYPDGDYVFNYQSPSTGSVSQPVTLGNPAKNGSGLPAAPKIQLHQNGLPITPSRINPNLDLQVTWSNFDAGHADPLGIMDDLLFVIMADCNGDRLAHSGRPFENTPYLTYANKEFVITANKLDPEQIYQLSVEHAVLDTSIKHEVPAFATFATTTFVDIVTTGKAEPEQACLNVRKRFDGGQTDR